MFNNTNPVKQNMAQKMGSAMSSSLGAPQAAQAADTPDKGYKMYRTGGGITYMVVPHSNGRGASSNYSDDSILIPYSSGYETSLGGHKPSDYMDEVANHYKSMTGQNIGQLSSSSRADKGDKTITAPFPVGNTGATNPRTFDLTGSEYPIN